MIRDKDRSPSRDKHPHTSAESHIIRSDNKANLNEQMYGNTREESADEQKRVGVKADPSSFPGGDRVKD